jgi:hypothetical protein
LAGIWQVPAKYGGKKMGECLLLHFWAFHLPKCPSVVKSATDTLRLSIQAYTHLPSRGEFILFRKKTRFWIFLKIFKKPPF